MRVLDRLEKKLGPLAIPNLTVILIAGQSLVYVLFLTGKLQREATYLSAARLMGGEWWRLIAFPFDPPRQSLIFTLFAWYFFYILGSTLEQYWGNFRYNAYLLLGCVVTIAASFLTPAYPISNAFLAGSVFLAFATIFPDYEILLFFVLRMRIKWLALLAAAGYLFQLFFGDWGTRVAVLAATGNFLIFFARELAQNLRYGHRQLTRKVTTAVRKTEKISHRCTVCGITDQTHPDMDFRYCPKCDGQRGYCQEHIFSHQHVQKQ